MQFTWDSSRATLNRQKHGVGFEEAQTVFEDREALRIFGPDHSKETSTYDRRK